MYGVKATFCLGIFPEKQCFGIARIHRFGVNRKTWNAFSSCQKWREWLEEKFHQRSSLKKLQMMKLRRPPVLVISGVTISSWLFLSILLLIALRRKYLRNPIRTAKRLCLSLYWAHDTEGNVKAVWDSVRLQHASASINKQTVFLARRNSHDYQRINCTIRNVLIKKFHYFLKISRLV